MSDAHTNARESGCFFISVLDIGYIAQRDRPAVRDADDRVLQIARVFKKTAGLERELFAPLFQVSGEEVRVRHVDRLRDMEKRKPVSGGPERVENNAHLTAPSADHERAAHTRYFSQFINDVVRHKPDLSLLLIS